MNPVRVRGKGRPRGALGGVSRIAESSTRRYPSSWELPPSTAPAALDRPRSPKGQLFVVQIGLKRLTSTGRARSAIENGYINPYEPGTRRERAYMCGISSVYQEDNIEDAATIAAAAMEDTIIVQMPDTEGDLDELV